MEVLTAINDLIWNPMAYFALAVGLYFTVLTRGVQFRLLPAMFRAMREKHADEGGIAPMQALLLTLSSRVGIGNIAGVGTAIAAGGPGALFWMVMVALVGSASAFAESTLAQVYKRKIDGEHRGGIPFYVEHGLKLKWLAVAMAVITMVGYGFIFPSVQSNSIAVAMDGAFQVPTWVTAIVLTAMFAFVVLGGTKRIVRAAEFMVPFMALGYIVAALVIVALNLHLLVPTIELILSSAFGMHQVFGGIAGSAIAWGVRRAVFSNVAGVGEGTFGSAAAAVTHPAKQGLVQSFSIFIDTIVVCSATGIMILMTGSYNVTAPDGTVLVEHVPGMQAGVAYTQHAINDVLAGFGPGFVAIALFFFAFTTLVAFYYIANTNLSYLTGRSRGVAQLVLKLGMLGVTFYGCVQSAEAVWAVGDIGYGTLGWLNMLCILALSRVVVRTLADFDRQLKAGKDPGFDPVAAGIDGADYWTSQRTGLLSVPAADELAATDPVHPAASAGRANTPNGKEPR